MEDMASSSGMSNLRRRKTVQSTSSSPDAVFDGGRLLPTCRSKKINDNVKETQFSVLSSIPRETQNVPQLHDSKQIELTTMQRFQQHPKALSFRPIPKAPSSQIASQKCSQPKAPSSQLVLKALSSKIASQTEGLSCQFDPLKSSVASTSSDAPTIAIIPTKTSRDGSKAFTYLSGTSETSKMDVSDIDYWKNRVKRIEERVMEMKKLEDIEDAVLELQRCRDASDRRFKEFENSYESVSLEKFHETMAMFKKEREYMKQCLSKLVRRTNSICSRPLLPHQ